MNISECILLITAVIIVWYTIETRRIRKMMVNQLDGLRKSVLLSAYASLFKINIRIIEQDSSSDIAREMEHYKKAVEKVGDCVVNIEMIIDELKKDTN